MEIFLFLPGLFAFLLFKYFRYDVNFGNSLWFFVLFYFVNCFMPCVLCFVRALVHVQLQFDIKLKDMRKLKDIYKKNVKKTRKYFLNFVITIIRKNPKIIVKNHRRCELLLLQKCGSYTPMI